MPCITLFAGSYCQKEEVARKLTSITGYKKIDDQTLIDNAVKRFPTDESKLLKAMTGKPSVFNKFTHEKERSLAYLKVVLADFLKEDNLLLCGYSGHLIPKDISHILKVCMIADVRYRSGLAVQLEGLSEKEALKKIHKDDESRVLWVEYLFNHKDPWDSSLYDVVLPMDKYSVDGAAEEIHRNIRKDVLRVTDLSRRAVDDFVLSSQVDLKLAAEGHNVSVSSKDGSVTITINKHVIMLSSLEEELRRIVSPIPGVSSVETRVGPGFYKTDIYRKYDFDLPLPSKVLLVDDEREFVHMLSERLQMRDMASAVAYDGAEALSVIDEEEPEVMVLDLKMPGVDGLEVLRRVRDEHPNVEVIVLTGHGSKEIEKQCMEMGACAYLEKPVNIEKLTQIMQEAHARLKTKKKS
jgi:CheY-like chemotaxis protein/cytidylate kinase